MSVELSNLEGGNSNCQTSENFAKCVDTPKVINSKIRKFFFTLHEKQIERDLKVTISVGGSNDTIGESSNILLELTNGANPIFLFLLCISKNDFETLRKDQGLNVEFKDFPEALVNLLDQCNNGENAGRFKLMLVDYCGTASGGRIMDMNRIQVKFIEECAFKNICHLSLTVVRGTDLQIRQKLEIELYQVKQALLKKSKLYDETLMKVSELVEQVDEKTKIIENLSATLDHVKIEAEEASLKERARAEKQEKATREECDERINQERIEFQKRSSQMQNKIDKLEKELKLFHEKQLEMHTLLHDKERDKELIEVELMSKKQEVNQLKSQNEKLDSDYHDKERTVNILRTRLAVAEQELKDNNVHLLNHQNKLDETIQENINLQKKCDFFQDKFERNKESGKALTDEIVKANEIISKQQSKIKLYSSKLNECELRISKLERILKLKEDDLCVQSELLNKQQEDFIGSSEERKKLKERNIYLEKTIAEISDKLKSKLNTITSMRKNFEDHLAEFQSPHKSLLKYRTFLSMPTLLPSEYNRHTDDLWDFIEQDQTLCDYDTPSCRDPSEKSFKPSRIVKPYVSRYLKRFENVPLSVFKTLDSLLTMLISPHEFNSVQDIRVHKTSSFKNINCSAEYDFNNEAAENPSPTAQPNAAIKQFEDVLIMYEKAEDVVFNQSKNVERHQKNTGIMYDQSKDINFDNITTCDTVKKAVHTNPVVNRCTSTNESKKDKDFGLGSNQEPHYAPVSAFGFKPVERFSKLTLPGYSDNRFQNEKNKGTGSNVRTMPAITAPPLTAEQRNCMDSIFKTYRSNWPSEPKPMKQGIFKISSAQSVLCKKTQNPRSHLTSCEYAAVCDRHAMCNRNVPVPTNCEKFSNGPNTLSYDHKHSVPTSKFFLKSYEVESLPKIQEFEGSLDLDEPSAYFAT